MELSQCINERRSIRDYQTKEVSRETILELINAAIKAPSWKNSQVSRYYVTDTSEKTKEFLPQGRKCLTFLSDTILLKDNDRKKLRHFRPINVARLPLFF